MGCALFYACVNSVQEVNDFLADKNLPISESEHLVHVYKDSGNIVFRLKTPLMLDFSNRTSHPYSEFPKGVELVTIDRSGSDSTTIVGNYGISYTKTRISEIIGDVEVHRHGQNSKLTTSQLYWDQNTHYIFTEKPFVLTLEQDTIHGVGFESRQNLQGWVLKEVHGGLELKEE